MHIAASCSHLLHHDSLSDSTAMIAAAASPTGVYRPSPSLSLADSVGMRLCGARFLWPVFGTVTIDTTAAVMGAVDPTFAFYPLVSGSAQFANGEIFSSDPRMALLNGFGGVIVPLPRETLLDIPIHK